MAGIIFCRSPVFPPLWRQWKEKHYFFQMQFNSRKLLESLHTSTHTHSLGKGGRRSSGKAAIANWCKITSTRHHVAKVVPNSHCRTFRQKRRCFRIHKSSSFFKRLRVWQGQGPAMTLQCLLTFPVDLQKAERNKIEQTDVIVYVLLFWATAYSVCQEKMSASWTNVQRVTLQKSYKVLAT